MVNNRLLSGDDGLANLFINDGKEHLFYEHYIIFPTTFSHLFGTLRETHWVITQYWRKILMMNLACSTYFDINLSYTITMCDIEDHISVLCTRTQNPIIHLIQITGEIVLSREQVEQ